MQRNVFFRVGEGGRRSCLAADGNNGIVPGRHLVFVHYCMCSYSPHGIPDDVGVQQFNNSVAYPAGDQ